MTNNKCSAKKLNKRGQMFPVLKKLCDSAIKNKGQMIKKITKHAG